jgi:uncharacterized protein YggT (Ycf19 family)
MASEVITQETTVHKTNTNVDERYFSIQQGIYYVLGIIESLLLLRFIFKLLAANPASGFIQLIYSITDALLLPFRGIFPTSAVEGSVMEWSTLVAMLIYWLIAYGIEQFVKMSTD